MGYDFDKQKLKELGMLLFRRSNKIFTPKQALVAAGLLKGLKINEVAILLSRSNSVVEKHVNCLKNKLNCSTMFELGNKVGSYLIQ